MWVDEGAPARCGGCWQRFALTLFLGPLFGFHAVGQSGSPALLRPAAVAYDAAGDLFIADADRSQVFEITLAGALTTFAGSGVQGFAGDGGPAMGAQLNRPQGLAVAQDGSVYIADTGNQRIRVVQNGQITTFAGGAAGFSGDGGSASAAAFNQPAALALDTTGALLICDRGNQRLRRVSGGVITTVAGDGIQGFAGDGGPATAAEINEPSGVAVGSDGRIYIADTGNQRVRVVTVNGTIATFAGTGVAGFSGDGGRATAAQLNRPAGLAMDATGELLVADQNNQRFRRIATDGTITTIAGSGVQGANSDGAAATTAQLNSPGAVGFSTFGWPLVSDPANHTVRVLLDNGNLYEPAGLVARTTTLNPTTPSAVYGTASAALTVGGSAGTPRGVVQVFDGPAAVGQGTLAQGAARVSLPTLGAGTHTLTSVYVGDGVHPAATASSTTTVAPAPVIATAAAATVSYGAPMPVLSGTITGVLARDTGNVSAVFSANMPPLPSVGTYPISVTLSGPASGNYTVSMGTGSGSLTVVPATAVVTMSPVTNAYVGLPLQLTARVASTAQGVPTGSVTFLDGTTTVATAPLVNGSATAVYLTPAGGSHTLTASYSGNGNFLSGTSPGVVANIVAMPDFGISVMGSSQQVAVAGSTANYGLNVASQGGPFTGAVTLSASGLPSGASASFSPPAVVPGAGSAAVTMTIATSAAQARMQRVHPLAWVSSAMLLLPLVRRRRARLKWMLLALIAFGGFTGLSGCGARVAPESVLPVEHYNVTVTATSTNLAGNVVVHSVNVVLGVE